jgi:hypothetical protein
MNFIFTLFCYIDTRTQNISIDQNFIMQFSFYHIPIFIPSITNLFILFWACWILDTISFNKNNDYLNVFQLNDLYYYIML